MIAGASEALARATGSLREAGIDSPAREARLLLAHAQGRSGGLPDLTGMVPPGYWVLVGRRRAREPMALILGRQGFWTLDLEVSADTLIPRADTETLIELALSVRPERERVRRVLDLGTGTGALLLAALSEFTDAYGIGVDVSPGAAALASRNAERHGLATRCGIVVGCWADAIGGRFDLVFANPPYVASGDIAGLMPEVRRYEPARALDGGPDGLDAYRHLLPELPRLLAPGGVAVLEFGQGQAGEIERLGRNSSLGEPKWGLDLAGTVRAAAFRRPFG